MTSISTIAYTFTPSLTMVPAAARSSQAMYHVVIENLNSLGNQINRLLMALIVAIITSALSWLIQRMRDHHLKEEESREKLYALLRLRLSTLRSIDRHFRKIRRAGDEADRYTNRS